MRKGFAKGVAIIALLIIVGLMGYVVWQGGLSVENIQNPFAPEPQTGDRVALELPIKFVIKNRLTGAAYSPTSVALYNSEGYVIESLTVSGGVATTSGYYMSGERFFLKIVDGSAFYFVDVVLPTYDAVTASIKAPDYHTIDVLAVDIPADAVVKVLNATGAEVTSVSISSTTPFTVLVTNDDPDTALPDAFYNPQMGANYDSAIIITVSGSGSVLPRIQGATLLYQTSGLAVYKIDVSDLACVTDPRTGSATPKSESYSIAIDPTGVSSGAYTVSIALYTDVDLSYVSNYGTVNSDAVQLGSATLTVNV